MAGLCPLVLLGVKHSTAGAELVFSQHPTRTDIASAETEILELTYDSFSCQAEALMAILKSNSEVQTMLLSEMTCR